MSTSPPRIYLNSAATSWPKPDALIDATVECLRAPGGTPGRGAGETARRTIDRVRMNLARLIGASDPMRIVVTSGTTEAINLAVHGVLDRAIEQGRRPVRVVCSSLEHNSVVRPIHFREQRGDAEIVKIGVDSAGRTDVDELIRAVDERTELVAVTGASNATGVVQPIEEIGTRLRERGSRALLLVDGAQSVGSVETEVEKWGVDLLTIAGHKCLLGPTGIGALYVGPRAFDRDAGIDRLVALKQGGTGTDARNAEMPVELPRCFEAGTHNTVGLAALLGSLESPEVDYPAILAHERTLVVRLIGALRDESRVVMAYPDNADRTGVLSFAVPGAAAHEIAGILDQSFGISVRAGLHCAPWAHETLGTAETGMIRVSPGWKSTEQDIDAFVQALGEVLDEIIGIRA